MEKELVFEKIKEKFKDRRPSRKDVFNYICPLSMEAYKAGECLSFNEYNVIRRGGWSETANYIYTKHFS